MSSHLQQVRQAMPATTGQVYLNTGTFGPLPDVVIDTMQKRLHKEWQRGRLGAEAFHDIFETYNAARASVARLIGAETDEIALTDNTGEGINIVCHGFNWQEGDEVITTNHEHISGLAPLYQVRDRYGIQIHTADLGTSADRSPVEAIEPLITPRTRLIEISHVTWTTGTVLDINAVGRLAHAHGIPILIDGAQSAGNIPLNMRELDVDFYAIPMQKWLCGPDGTGALYVRQQSRQTITSTYVGYYSIDFEAKADWQLQTTARAFEAGGRQTAAIAGQHAVLQWLEEFVGHAWLFEQISTLNKYAAHMLKDIPDLTIVTPEPGASGLLAFTWEGRNTEEVVKKLAEQNIFIRDIHGGLLRVSTGFYNSEEDIDALASALRKMA
jgi:L-cysteine/cystine lyase